MVLSNFASAALTIFSCFNVNFTHRLRKPGLLCYKDLPKFVVKEFAVKRGLKGRIIIFSDFISLASVLGGIIGKRERKCLLSEEENANLLGTSYE